MKSKYQQIDNTTVWYGKYYFSDGEEGQNNLLGNVRNGFTEEAAFEGGVRIFQVGKQGKGNFQQEENYVQNKGVLSWPGVFSHRVFIYSFFIQLIFIVHFCARHWVECSVYYSEGDRRAPIIKFSLVWMNTQVTKIIMDFTRGKHRVL